MKTNKPRMVCDLCKCGYGGSVCLAGGVDKCFKNGEYTKFELRNPFSDIEDRSDEIKFNDGMDD